MFPAPDKAALRRAMPHNPVAARRNYSGPALFSFGFRPFFLFGAVWGCLIVPVWIAAYVTSVGEIGHMPALLWHIHEMLFGFLAAIVAGFLLTAVPNWTGRLPVMGWPLFGLFAVWVAGRIIMLTAAPPVITALMDSGFLILLAALLWREIITGGNIRNIPVCVLATLLALANAGFHTALLLGLDWQRAQSVAIGVVALLLALIGGRIIPSFTRNWMVQTSRAPLPAPAGRFDLVALAGLVPALLAWILSPYHPVTAILLALAGGLHAARMFRWKGWRTGQEWLVLVLHAGYAWLPLGLFLMASAAFWPDIVPASAALHAVTAGAMGTMTLAVMTRASLGHTGHPRTADRWTVVLYLSVVSAALIRVTVPIVLPQFLFAGMTVSALLWSAAFALFVLRYGPMLLQPRKIPQPNTATR